MPDVVPAECFLGLPPQERWEQLYWAAGGTLECFLGLDRREQLEAFLEAVGAETCYGTEEDFWRNWAEVLGVECIPAGLEDVQLAVYTALYEQAENEDLLPPECFLGAGPDGQMLAFFDSLVSINSLPRLDAPTGVEANGNDGGTWSALWDPVVNATGYEWRILEVSAVWTPVATTAADGGGLPVGPYTFQVRATAPGYQPSIASSDGLEIPDTGFDPGDYGDVSLWLKADQLVEDGAVDEDVIDIWPDQSGSGNDATQATFSKQPVLIEGAIGGYPEVQFDGLDDYLSVLGSASAFTGDFTFSCVLRVDDQCVPLSAGAYLTQGWYYQHLGTYSEYYANTPVAITPSGPIPPAPPIGEYGVLTIKATTAGVSLYFNGVLYVANPATPRTGGFDLMLGSYNATGFYMPGSFPEILSFSELLSDANREAVEDYLGEKYGITITH